MTKWQGIHLLEGRCISVIGRDQAASFPQDINVAVVQPKGQRPGLNVIMVELAGQASLFCLWRDTPSRQW